MIIPYKVFKPYINKFLKKLLITFKEEILGVAIFGSVIKNKATEDSDIDILILWKNRPKAPHHKYYKLEEELKDSRQIKSLDEYVKKHGNLKWSFSLKSMVFPIHLDLEEFNANPWILVEFADYGKILYDPNKLLKNKFNYIHKRLKELSSKKIILEDGKYYWDLKPDWKPGDIVKL